MTTSPTRPESSSPRTPIGADMFVFDGFPYLVTRVVPTLYHVILLPADLPEAALREAARAQWRANRLDTGLVLGENTAVYIAAADGTSAVGPPPRGGILVAGKLQPVAAFASSELDPRHRRLAAVIAERCPRGGTLFGDLSKGGREATADEVGRLAGAGPEGVPRGLDRCPTCGDWRGRCLDPSPQFLGMVMPVHCRCANDSRCAACGQLLHDRKLNANYYEPADGSIWHVPGFSAFGHRCPQGRATASR